MIETKRITAAEARGLMKPTEKEEFMLSRIYLAIENVARKRKRKLFFGVHSTNTAVERVKAILEEDGYEVQIKPPCLYDEFTTHAFVISW